MRLKSVLYIFSIQIIAKDAQNPPLILLKGLYWAKYKNIFLQMQGHETKLNFSCAWGRFVNLMRVWQDNRLWANGYSNSYNRESS